MRHCFGLPLETFAFLPTTFIIGKLTLAISQAESTPDGSLKEDNLDGSEAQDSSAEGSEIVELYLSIQDGITNLFRLSTIIRKKPEVDEYIKAASKFRDMDPLSDIVHVGDKYPRAREGETWLRDRLGTAITRRRQYLFYRKEHQERMEKVSKSLE